MVEFWLISFFVLIKLLRLTFCVCSLYFNLVGIDLFLCNLAGWYRSTCSSKAQQVKVVMLWGLVEPYIDQSQCLQLCLTVVQEFEPPLFFLQRKSLPCMVKIDLPCVMAYCSSDILTNKAISISLSIEYPKVVFSYICIYFEPWCYWYIS